MSVAKSGKKRTEALRAAGVIKPRAKKAKVEASAEAASSSAAGCSSSHASVVPVAPTRKWVEMSDEDE